MAELKCWCGGQVVLSATLPPKEVCLDSVFHDPKATGRREAHRKLYIAGPMTGYPDCNYPLFNEVHERLEAAGYEVLNPAKAVVGSEAHYVDFIREDLRMMLDCDGVALLDRWWESTGARNEVNVAGVLLMPCRPWQEWLERAHQELGS